MSKSKKIIISLSVAFAALLIALVTVISVWAATSQTVTNQLTVHYTATNVSATVKAEYNIPSGQFDDTAWQEIGNISFAASDSTTSKSIAAKTLDLPKNTYTIYFRYSFTNHGSNTITATLNETSTQTVTNMWFGYGFCSKIEYEAATEPLGSVQDFPENGPITVDVAMNETYYIISIVEVENIAFDASYTGMLSWNLTNKTA